MRTYKTLDEARAGAETPRVVCVAEIEHATEGCCFVRLICGYEHFARVLKATPLPEIVRLVAEHDVRTPEQKAAYLARIEAENPCRCDRCGVKVDRATAYSQDEWARFGGKRVKVKAFYCDDCSRLLRAIGAGEYSAMRERAAAVPSYEPETYEDY